MRRVVTLIIALNFTDILHGAVAQRVNQDGPPVKTASPTGINTTPVLSIFNDVLTDVITPLSLVSDSESHVPHQKDYIIHSDNVMNMGIARYSEAMARVYSLNQGGTEGMFASWQEYDVYTLIMYVLLYGGPLLYYTITSLSIVLNSACCMSNTPTDSKQVNNKHKTTSNNRTTSGQQASTKTIKELLQSMACVYIVTMLTLIPRCVLYETGIRSIFNNNEYIEAIVTVCVVCTFGWIVTGVLGYIYFSQHKDESLKSSNCQVFHQIWSCAYLTVTVLLLITMTVVASNTTDQNTSVFMMWVVIVEWILGLGSAVSTMVIAYTSATTDHSGHTNYRLLENCGAILLFVVSLIGLISSFLLSRDINSIPLLFFAFSFMFSMVYAALRLLQLRPPLADNSISNRRKSVFFQKSDVLFAGLLGMVSLLELTQVSTFYASKAVGVAIFMFVPIVSEFIHLIYNSQIDTTKIHLIDSVLLVVASALCIYPVQRQTVCENVCRDVQYLWFTSQNGREWHIVWGLGLVNVLGCVAVMRQLYPITGNEITTDNNTQKNALRERKRHVTSPG